MTTRSGRTRLGRGLEALLGPQSIEQARLEGALREIPVDAIRPNPYQPRREFEAEALSELAESMRSSGLLQPVVVRPNEDGKFELIAGERRWRAAQQLGWPRMGAVVRDVDDRTLLTLALIENLQRDALSPIDEARGYARLIGEFSVSQVEVGTLVGRDRSTVANALRLLKLPEKVQDLVHKQRLSTGHARALLQLDDPEAMTRLAQSAVEQKLSVRELEALTRGGRVPARRPRALRGARPPDPEIRRVEDALRRRLKTDVFVRKRGKEGGRIAINFYSNDDLERLLEIVLGERFDG
jgi:ParB family chromosome partitioning protein